VFIVSSLYSATVSRFATMEAERGVRSIRKGFSNVGCRSDVEEIPEVSGAFYYFILRAVSLLILGSRNQSAMESSTKESSRPVIFRRFDS